MCVCACDGCVSTHVDRPSSLFPERTNERTTRGGPIPSRSLFFSFFFLFAMLMRDELACISRRRRRCRRRPSVRPSVSPRHEAGSFLSSLTSVHVGGTQVAHPTGGWSVDLFAAERHVQNKRKKEIWVSLSRRAQIPHSTRTNVHGSAPLHPHHKPALHYLLVLATTTTATKMPYVSNPGCFVFLQCRALTRDIRYTLPPSCPLARRKDDAKLASSTVSYIPY